jgi:hypothetical protein
MHYQIITCGQTDMTKLTVAFCNSANAPKKWQTYAGQHNAFPNTMLCFIKVTDVWLLASLDTQTQRGRNGNGRCKTFSKHPVICLCIINAARWILSRGPALSSSSSSSLMLGQPVRRLGFRLAAQVNFPTLQLALLHCSSSVDSNPPPPPPRAIRDCSLLVGIESLPLRHSKCHFTACLAATWSQQCFSRYTGTERVFGSVQIKSRCTGLHITCTQQHAASSAAMLAYTQYLYPCPVHTDVLTHAPPPPTTPDIPLHQWPGASNQNGRPQQKSQTNVRLQSLIEFPFFDGNHLVVSNKSIVNTYFAAQDPNFTELNSVTCFRTLGSLQACMWII